MFMSAEQRYDYDMRRAIDACFRTPEDSSPTSADQDIVMGEAPPDAPATSAPVVWNQAPVPNSPFFPLRDLEMNQNMDGGRLSQSTTVVGDISMVTNTSNPVPLNAMDQAKEGKVALDAGDYDRAVELYTLAINNKPEAVDYYIQRSIAYTRLKQNPDHHAALKDAETAVLLAYKREKKELIMKAQLRRVIALASLNRLGDADFLLKILRKMHGPRDYRNNKKDDPMLDAWETRVEVKMAKLNPDDEQLEVTVKEKPEQQVEHAMAMTSLDNAEKEAAEKAKVKEEKGKAGVTQAVKDIRHDYYQSSDMINITIYARFVQERDVVSTIKEDYLHVSFPTVNGEQYTLIIDPLFAKVDVDKSKFSVLRNGLSVQLKKAIPAQKWPSLHGDAKDTSSSTYSRSASGDTPTVSDVKSGDATSVVSEAPTAIKSERTPAPTTPKAPSYPTSSKSGPKDWDKIASESLASKEKKKDEGASGDDGDEDSDDGAKDGVDKFFRKLYATADPDTKRAMMKSFTESDGTTLSTNWEEVKKGPVEPKPPRDD